MRFVSLRAPVTLLLLVFCLVASNASAQTQFFHLNGFVEGDWDSASFPNQSFDVPLDGLLIVSPINSKLVRITGSYAYEAEVQWICPFAFCPSWWLSPYPFSVATTVDLVATRGVQNGKPVYRAPSGQITSETWIGALAISHTTSERVTLPDLVLEPGRSGWSGDWYADEPWVRDANGHITTFHFEGSY